MKMKLSLVAAIALGCPLSAFCQEKPKPLKVYVLAGHNQKNRRRDEVTTSCNPHAYVRAVCRRETRGEALKGLYPAGQSNMTGIKGFAEALIGMQKKEKKK